MYISIFNPSHPGELTHENIKGLRQEANVTLTLEEVAEGLGTIRKTLSAILNKRQRVTPEMALRLAAAFRDTTAEFWLTVQEHYDPAQARRRVSVENVRVFWAPTIT